MRGKMRALGPKVKQKRVLPQIMATICPKAYTWPNKESAMANITVIQGRPDPATDRLGDTLSAA
ncbi:hypothetical protein [Lentibacter sp. XHP0401]|uniref:hypothetical protein n=1 Tax=Lentibacter sp. XHP0401 TaxID=2984334 RepID=UPI0021E832F4|nr:hypothetical protein [Lentibacter sp. XHP0401]MCV2891615.1 hypothetical protein [Lentibacter sp. XHP0401]